MTEEEIRQPTYFGKGGMWSRFSTVNFFLNTKFCKVNMTSLLFISLQASWYCQFDMWLVLQGASARRTYPSKG